MFESLASCFAFRCSASLNMTVLVRRWVLPKSREFAKVKPMSSTLYDVAIIGGGPAGSTAAALLARAGRRVVLFEREKFPRFHIGESLLPFSMKAFTRLGLHEKFSTAGFLKKYGGE